MGRIKTNRQISLPYDPDLPIQLSLLYFPFRCSFCAAASTLLAVWKGMEKDRVMLLSFPKQETLLLECLRGLSQDGWISGGIATHFCQPSGANPVMNGLVQASELIGIMKRYRHLAWPTKKRMLFSRRAKKPWDIVVFLFIL